MSIWRSVTPNFHHNWLFKPKMSFGMFTRHVENLTIKIILLKYWVYLNIQWYMIQYLDEFFFCQISPWVCSFAKNKSFDPLSKWKGNNLLNCVRELDDKVSQKRMNLISTQFSNYTWILKWMQRDLTQQWFDNCCKVLTHFLYFEISMWNMFLNDTF